MLRHNNITIHHTPSCAMFPDLVEDDVVSPIYDDDDYPRGYSRSTDSEPYLLEDGEIADWNIRPDEIWTDTLDQRLHHSPLEEGEIDVLDDEWEGPPPERVKSTMCVTYTVPTEHDEWVHGVIGDDAIPDHTQALIMNTCLADSSLVPSTSLSPPPPLPSTGYVGTPIVTSPRHPDPPSYELPTNLRGVFFVPWQSNGANDNHLFPSYDTIVNTFGTKLTLDLAKVTKFIANVLRQPADAGVIRAIVCVTHGNQYTLVMAMMYIERLVRSLCDILKTMDYKRVLLGCMILANKTELDAIRANVDIAARIENCSTQDLNSAEWACWHGLRENTSINRARFMQYFVHFT
jgi:hypothetical protein